MITAPDLVSTLVVEATVHLLDLTPHLEGGRPASAALAHIRRVLEGLYDGPLPARWSDDQCP